MSTPEPPPRPWWRPLLLERGEGRAFYTTFLGGVVLAAALAIASALGLYLSGQFWPFLDHLASPVTLPRWVLYVTFFGSMLLLGGVVLSGLRRVRQPWRKYVEDEADGFLWRWHWIGGRVRNLRAFCLRCDCELGFSPHLGEGGEQKGINLYCSHCNWQTGIMGVTSLEATWGVKFERRRNVGEWRQRLNRPWLAQPAPTPVPAELE